MRDTQRRRAVLVVATATCLLVAGGLVPARASVAPAQVYAWGASPGDGTPTASSTPKAVSGMGDAVGVAASVHALVLRTGGTVWAWGDNEQGEVGTGASGGTVYSPTQVVGLTGVTSVAAGGNYSIAIRSDKTLWTWGRGFGGELGTGCICRQTSPAQVTSLSNVVLAAGGGTHGLAALGDGTVWAWGLNDHGQVGDGTTTDRPTPVKVPGITNVVALAGGRDFSFAIRTDGTLWAWGSNSFGGAVGDGSGVDQHTPVQILANVSAVAAGSDHAIALLQDGTVRTWGSNSWGQLGDGSTTDRPTPTAVAGLSGIRGIGTTSQSSMAVAGDGTVRAWGLNHAGELGDGATTDRHSPVTVAGLTGVQVLGSGPFGEKSLAIGPVPGGTSTTGAPGTTATTAPTTSTSSTAPPNTTTTSYAVPPTSSTTGVPSTTTTAIPGTTTTAAPGTTTTTAAAVPTTTTTTAVPPTATTTSAPQSRGTTTTTTAPASQSPIQLSTSVSPPGGAVRITGGGFGPGQSLVIDLIGPTTRRLGSARSDQSGNVTTTVTVPGDAPAGEYRIVVSGRGLHGEPHEAVASLTVSSQSHVADPVVAGVTFTG